MKKAHRKLIDISKFTKVCVNQKSVNVCEQTIQDTGMKQPSYCQLYCVFTFIRHFLIDKDVCNCQNISLFSQCSFVFVLHLEITPCGKESTKVQITQKKKKLKRKLLPKKLRDLWTKSIHKHRSLTETFRQSQMSFSIRRD